MVLEQFENIIKSYYPNDLSSLEDYDKYILSPENKRLSSVKAEAFHSQKIRQQIDMIISKVKEYKHLEKIEDLTSENFDRCFSLKIDFMEEKYLHQLYIRISVLVPYYTIYVLTNSIIKKPYQWLNQPKRDTKYEKLISKDIILLQKIVENQTDYTLIKDSILNHKINNISYEDINFGDFTIFNALFTNDNL